MRRARIIYKREEAGVLTQDDNGFFTYRYNDLWMADNGKPSNTRIHVADSDFALDEGLLPKNTAKGTAVEQFHLLAGLAELNKRQAAAILDNMLSNSVKVAELIEASYLSEDTKRNYLQAYQTRYKKLKQS